MKTFISNGVSFQNSPTKRLVMATHGSSSREYDCLSLWHSVDTPCETKQLIENACMVLIFNNLSVQQEKDLWTFLGERVKGEPVMECVQHLLSNWKDVCAIVGL